MVTGLLFTLLAQLGQQVHITMSSFNFFNCCAGWGYILAFIKVLTIKSMWMERSNQSQMTKQASFIESVLLGEVHHPQSQGQRSCPREMAAQFL
jgi:hypothetical protein